MKKNFSIFRMAHFVFIRKNEFYRNRNTDEIFSKNFNFVQLRYLNTKPPNERVGFQNNYSPSESYRGIEKLYIFYSEKEDLIKTAKNIPNSRFLHQLNLGTFIPKFQISNIKSSKYIGK